MRKEKRGQAGRGKCREKGEKSKLRKRYERKSKGRKDDRQG